MSDQTKIRGFIGGIARELGDMILPKPNERPETPGQLLGLGVRSVLGSAAIHFAGVIEIVTCSVCREDATKRKPEGQGDYLYMCEAHAQGDGWEDFTQESTSAAPSNEFPHREPPTQR